MSGVIQHPTWLDIYAMFTGSDIFHMKNHGLDLSSYEQVYALAHKIYYYLGYKLMPLKYDGHTAPWSDDQIATYNNWLIDGRPQDEAHRAQIAAEKEAVVAQAGHRVRKDINSLDKAEIAKLKAAFKGLMDRDPKSESEYDPDAKCYFSLAAKHWFPVPTYCQHHIYGFISWHRWQMLDFEDALRSVPGCEDVTLPYWNIETGKFPSLISEAPFKEYKFPISVYPTYYDPKDGPGHQGKTTERWPQFMQAKGKLKWINAYRANVNIWISHARTAPTFAAFNGLTGYLWKRPKSKPPKYDTKGAIIRAHDYGHVGSGPTMANQDIAAFDPMFWFFHCNWDRLWWEWQVARHATTLEGFKKTLGKSEDDDQRWLIDPQMSISDPFCKSNSDGIDLTKLGIAYASPAPVKSPVTERAIAMAPSWRNPNDGQSTRSTFTIAKHNLDRVSLRVKGVNRIQISGSFWVVLYLGGEEVGRDAFFQSTFSGDCENCVQQARVDFDFVFDRSHLTDADGNPKEIKVEVINAITDEVMPFDKIGNPTINIRMLH